MQSTSASYPNFGQYVSRGELADRVRRLNDDLRAGNAVPASATSPVRSVSDNDAFVASLGHYAGDSLEQIRASAMNYEKRMHIAHKGGFALGAVGILASFGALGYAVNGLTAGGMGGAIAGIAVFAVTNYAARKAVDMSNHMLEKAEGHGRFQTSLQGWVDFLADERVRQFEQISKMSTATLDADGIQSTPDAVRIGGIWVPRKQP